MIAIRIELWSAVNGRRAARAELMARDHPISPAGQRMPPGPERARLRSETFPGLATACAQQWGQTLNPAQGAQAA